MFGETIEKTIVGNFLVSTVSLGGIDHNFSGKGPPLLYETMVFRHGSWSDLYCDRYATREEAEEGHKKAVLAVENGEIVVENE